jgi:hypothetical protein
MGRPLPRRRQRDAAEFHNPEGAWREASFANYPLGMALIGFFNVDS